MTESQFSACRPFLLLRMSVYISLTGAACEPVNILTVWGVVSVLKHALPATCSLHRYSRKDIVTEDKNIKSKDLTPGDGEMEENTELTHLDSDGKPHMVDVSGKTPTRRVAGAKGEITVGDRVKNALIDSGRGSKGDVFNTAVVAGIQAAKRTSELIPLCHPLQTESIDISHSMDGNTITAVCRVTGTGKTGFEMEALTGVTVFLLTVYDMTKSLDRTMEIGGIRLVSKSGGKSGEYKWQQ